MASPTFESFTSEQIPDEVVAEASRLFSENYGTWGALAHIPGQPVSATPQKLKREYLRSEGESTSSYTRAVIDGKAVAHAFVSRWKCEDWTVCWVTQLVVDKRFRRQGLATGVLKALRRNTDDVYGIVSSHPAACMAAAKAFGSYIGIDLDFISQNAENILRKSHVPYLADADLRGTIFREEDDETGLISSMHTRFFIDHTEPRAVLATILQNNDYTRREWRWPLGGLAEGHEFIAMFLV